MSFWNTEAIELRVPNEKIVTPYRRDHVKNAAYELTLGTEAYITSSNERTKHIFKAGDHIDIPPGQFALLHTREIVAIPDDSIAFISIKARIKLKGLVNISGFHVDPGFKGQLIFSVYNAGSRSVKIQCGDPAFLIWFSSLIGKTKDTYKGHYSGQRGISPEAVMEIEGDICSPAALASRIGKLEDSIAAMKWWFCALAAGVIGAVVKNYLGK